MLAPAGKYSKIKIKKGESTQNEHVHTSLVYKDQVSQERSKVTEMCLQSRLVELTAINLPSSIRGTLLSLWPI